MFFRVTPRHAPGLSDLRDQVNSPLMPRRKIALNPFALKVISYIQKIPKGKVATYGQIAALAGKPHAARAVGWILNSCAKSHKLPWQRVLGSTGTISFHKNSIEFAMQKRLLRKEGIIFSTQKGLDLATYQWRKKARKPSVSGRSRRPTMFD